MGHHVCFEYTAWGNLKMQDKGSLAILVTTFKINLANFVFDAVFWCAAHKD